MAQIRKFNGGGGIQIGDRLYTVDEINEFLHSVDASPQARAALAGIIEGAIAKDGQIIVYNQNSNTLSGRDLSSYLTNYFGSERRAERNAPGRSTRWANRQATRNTDFHVYNSAVASLANMPGYFKKKADDEAAAKKKKNVLKKINDPDGFYDLDEHGKAIFNANTISNIESMQRYRAIWDALESGDLSGYNLEEWSDPDTLDGLLPWYQALTPEQRALYTPEKITEVLSSNEPPAIEQMDILRRAGAIFNPNGGGKSSTFYVPEGADPDVVEQYAKAYGVSFEQTADGRHKLVDPSGQWRHVYGVGIPFLRTTDWENGYIDKDGLLYTAEEIAQGEAGPVGLALNPFFSAADSWRDTDDPYTSYTAFRDAIVADGLRTYLNFDDRNTFAHVAYDPSMYGIDGLWSASDWTKPMYIRDDSQYYNSTNPNYRVINYWTSGYNQYGLPNEKFRLMYKDEQGNTVYKDYDNEEAMIADGVVSKKSFVRTPKSSQIVMSAWETDHKGKRARKYSKTFKNDVVMIDAEGKFYYKKNLSNGKFELVPIEDTAKLQDILTHPEKYAQYETIENALKGNVGGSTPVSTPSGKKGAVVISNASSSADRMVEGLLNHKNGGKIRPLPKFITGGPIRSSTKVETTSEGSETSVSQTHAVKRDEGLGKDLKDAWEYSFTDAEKWQISGAITDLAGVALSFIPGAHYVSAATGLAGTAATFTGDIKKDGLDWGDVGRGLFSAVLDVGTVFTGGIAKTAKVVKVLKAAAKPIMKLFALYGITNGANAFAKMARGEDVTSEDLIDILRGLTSTAIGAKMFKQKVGDATLSKKIEDEVLKTQNANLKKAPEAKIGNQDIKLTEAEVNANIRGKSKAEVEEYLKGKVKEKLGDSFDETKHAQDLSKQFGIEYDKGEFDGLKWKNIFKGKGFVQRADGKAIFNPEEAATGHTWVGHYFRPGVRRANLGYDLGYWKKDGQLGVVTPNQYAAAQRMATGKLGTFYNRWAAQSLLQRSAVTPHLFKQIEFEKDPVRMTFSWGRPVYGRKPIDFYDQLSPTKGAREAFAIGPDGNPITFRTLETPVQGPIRNLSPQKEIIGIGFDGKPIYAPDPKPYSNAPFMSLWRDLYLNGNDYYKEGGKIQFAKGGTKIKKCQTPDGEGIPEGAQKGRAGLLYKKDADGVEYIVDAKGNWVLDEGGNKRKYDADVYDGVEGDISIYYKIDADGKSYKTDMYGNYILVNGNKVPTEAIEEARSVATEGASKYGNPIGLDNSSLNGFDWTPAVQIGQSLGNLGLTIGGLNRQKRNVDSIRPASYVSEQEHYTPLRRPGTSVFDSEVLRLKSAVVNPATADWYRNFAVRQTNSDQQRGINLQKVDYLTKIDNQNAMEETTSNRYYSANRAKIANLASKESQQTSATKAAYDSQHVADIIKNVQLAASDSGQIWQSAKAKRTALDRMDFQWDYEDWTKSVNDAYGVDKTEWEAKPENKGKTYMSREDYIKNDPTLRKQYRGFVKRNISFAKAGSKLRPVKEQMQIDSAKARDKAIAQLSKQAHDLLKTLLS